MSLLSRYYSNTTILSWLLLIFLCAPLRAQQSDFNKVKTPFELKNSWVDKFNEKLNEDKKDPTSQNARTLEYIRSVLPQVEAAKDYESLAFLLERNALILWSLRRDSLALASATKSVETAKKYLPSNHFLLSRAYFRRGYIEHKTDNFY
ncbi:hypothetical protein, partial [uncultured Roseivirga sp.]|uniref:hypothetical protein n=1 Tax=uncultured Roseivirga sp. TaxID=543088 RepID=UPI0030DDBECE